MKSRTTRRPQADVFEDRQWQIVPTMDGVTNTMLRLGLIRKFKIGRFACLSYTCTRFSHSSVGDIPRLAERRFQISLWPIVALLPQATEATAIQPFHLSLLSHWQCYLSRPFQRPRLSLVNICGEIGSMFEKKNSSGGILSAGRGIDGNSPTPNPLLGSPEGQATRLVFGSKQSLHVFRQTPFFHDRGHSTSFLS